MGNTAQHIFLTLWTFLMLGIGCWYGMRMSRKEARVLDEVSSISDEKLNNWIARSFMTVVPLAQAELARRKRTPNLAILAKGRKLVEK